MASASTQNGSISGSPKASTASAPSVGSNPPPRVDSVSASHPLLTSQAPLSSPEELLRVDERCTATSCFRLQWEAEINPRSREKTNFGFLHESFVFDGFYVIFHCKMPSIPRFEYTRGDVRCTISFVEEEVPLSIRQIDRRVFSENLFLFQRYVFQQLMGIHPMHLFQKISPPRMAPTMGPPGSAAKASACADFHIYPRFLSQQHQIINKQDLNAAHRIGFSLGTLLPIDRVMEYLLKTANFTAQQYIDQFGAQFILDSIITTRIQGKPGAFRVDEIVPKHNHETQQQQADGMSTEAAGAQSSTGEVVLKHVGSGSRNFDGSKSQRKIRSWKKQGQFLMLSPEFPPKDEMLVPAESHLTGFRTDVFELGSAMPMVFKFLRHCELLHSFELAMDLHLKDKALLRQAFTHASYVDVGMQNVNTYEATFARVVTGHKFENVEHLKRSRLEYEQAMAEKDLSSSSSIKDQVNQLAQKHLNGSWEFREEFYSRNLCPYERLEFLGDAALSFLIASSSFLKIPTAHEKDLHHLRCDLANNVFLGKLAREVNFDSLLLSAYDHTKLDDQVLTKIVADCFEALLGAVFLDQGINACRNLFGKVLTAYDPEKKETFFLSNEELVEYARDWVEMDRVRFESAPQCQELSRKHQEFVSRTRVPIQNAHIWVLCMTHNSFKEPQIEADAFLNSDPNYERVEFLGDAVLQLLSSQFLVDVFPNHQEHLLSRVRSSLVKNAKLAIVAKEHGYEEFFRLGSQVGKALFMQDVLADVFEATLGAVFLENGARLDPVQRVLEQTVFPRLQMAIQERQWMTPKDCLEQFVNQWNRNSQRNTSLRFSALNASTATKSKKAKGNQDGHSVGLYVNNGYDNEWFLLARATGRKLEDARNKACRRALQYYGIKLANFDLDDH